LITFLTIIDFTGFTAISFDIEIVIDGTIFMALTGIENPRFLTLIANLHTAVAFIAVSGFTGFTNCRLSRTNDLSITIGTFINASPIKEILIRLTFVAFVFVTIEAFIRTFIAFVSFKIKSLRTLSDTSLSIKIEFEAIFANEAFIQICGITFFTMTGTFMAFRYVIQISDRINRTFIDTKAIF
jgi:hypothetical protein